MSFEKYQELTDEEVLEQIHSQDQTGIDYLLEKYKHVVRQKARALFLIGGDRDDLIQEGMIGLYKAIRDYNKEKETSFSSFADLCISRQIYSAIKASNRKKNIPLNTYISFYAPVTDKENEAEDALSVGDVMSASLQTNPEEVLIDRESTYLIEQELERRLSSMELEVVRLYITGMKYTEIATLLSKEPKAIDNALQRIRSKVNQICKELGER